MRCVAVSVGIYQATIVSFLSQAVDIRSLKYALQCCRSHYETYYVYVLLASLV
jgi:hypothetical protein